MRNIVLRITSKGVAVVGEQTNLVFKKLFNNWDEALAYVKTLNPDEAFRRPRRTTDGTTPANKEQA